MKIADLAIFSLGIKNNGGVLKEEDFTVARNISGVRLRARATGMLITKALKLEATLKKATATTKAITGGGSSPSGGGSSVSSGTSSGSGTSVEGDMPSGGGDE